MKLCSAVGEKLVVFEAMEMLEEGARQGANVDMDSIFAKIPPIKPLEPLDRINE